MSKRTVFVSLLTMTLSVASMNCMAQAVQVKPRVESANSGLYYINGKRGAICRQMPDEYLKEGVVPVVNGKIVFSKAIDAAGKTKDGISKALLGWASMRYMPDTENGYWSDADYYRNSQYCSVKENDADRGHIVCQGDEEQVFSNATLSKDYARFQYTLTMDYSDGKVNVTVSNISYLYVLREEPERLLAEDYITDENCVNKKGKLSRMYGKFRTKTVDLVNELFAEIEGAVH